MDPTGCFTLACLLPAGGRERIASPLEKTAIAAFFRKIEELPDLRSVDLSCAVDVILPHGEPDRLLPLFIAGCRDATAVAHKILQYPTPLIDAKRRHFIHLPGVFDSDLFERVLELDPESVKSIDPKTSKTLLHKAIEAKAIDKCVRLMTLGVDLHAKDFEGKTALAKACYCLVGVASPEIELRKALVNLLVARGADPKSISFEDLVMFFNPRFRRVELSFLEELAAIGVDFASRAAEKEVSLEGVLYFPSLIDKVLGSLECADFMKQAEDGTIDFLDFDFEAIAFLSRCGVPLERTAHWAQSLFAKCRSLEGDSEYDSAAAESINQIFKKIEEVYLASKKGPSV